MAGAAATGLRTAAAGEQALLTARSTLVLTSRAARIPGPVDGSCTDLDDPGAAAVEASAARALGFSGKLCIHPRQVQPVNAAFAPQPDEVVWARGVVQAAAGGGAVRVDGHMVDAPVLQPARAILDHAGQARMGEKDQ